jgi:hypothetical protein
MYGVPYVKTIRKHPPLPFHQYIDRLINEIGQNEEVILTRDKINREDIITYSKNYSVMVNEINKKIKTERNVEYLDVSEINKIATSFISSITIVNAILSQLINVKILDGKNKLIEEIIDEDELKLIRASDDKLKLAFKIIDGIPYTISNMVIQSVYKRGLKPKFSTRELRRPEKMIFSKKGNGVFNMSDLMMLTTAHTTYSLAEIAFLHYITYPHMNPTRFPTIVLQTSISPIDYEKNKFDITHFSNELISRTAKNLEIYKVHLKFAKQWYNLK